MIISWNIWFIPLKQQQQHFKIALKSKEPWLCNWHKDMAISSKQIWFLWNTRSISFFWAPAVGEFHVYLKCSEHASTVNMPLNLCMRLNNLQISYTRIRVGVYTFSTGFLLISYLWGVVSLTGGPDRFFCLKVGLFWADMPKYHWSRSPT